MLKLLLAENLLLLAKDDEALHGKKLGDGNFSGWMNIVVVIVSFCA